MLTLREAALLRLDCSVCEGGFDVDGGIKLLKVMASVCCNGEGKIKSALDQKVFMSRRI